MAGVTVWVNFNFSSVYLLPIFAALKQDAQVAKLVDALCSGRSVRKDVLVRIQSWAQAVLTKSEWLFCFSEASLLAKAPILFSNIFFIPLSMCMFLNAEEAQTGYNFYKVDKALKITAAYIIG